MTRIDRCPVLPRPCALFSARLRSRRLSAQATWPENLKWLKEAVAEGKRIFDIGIDVARGAEKPSYFYPREYKAMIEAGYKRVYVGLVTVGKQSYRLYEWVQNIE